MNERDEFFRMRGIDIKYTIINKNNFNFVNLCAVHVKKLETNNKT
jgi:hypothetical protein